MSLAPSAVSETSVNAAKVSVVLAVNNGRLFLQEAIDSILGQSFRDFEFLIIDDGSTDGTLQLVQSYEDPRIVAIRLSENVGLVDALNIGVRRAQAPLIARMDADDVSHPRRLERQYAFMQSDPGAVLLGTSFTYIDESGNSLAVQRMPSGEHGLNAKLLETNQFCHPSVIFRRDAFEAVGGYRNVAGRSAQDYDLWLRLAEVGRVDNLEEPLLMYRVHAQQISIQKLAEQRRAANIYRAFALQRRSGQEESMPNAEKGSLLEPKCIAQDVVDDHLRWATLFFGAGRLRRAFTHVWAAFMIQGPTPHFIFHAARSAGQAPRIRRFRSALIWYLHRLSGAFRRN